MNKGSPVNWLFQVRKVRFFPAPPENLRMVVCGRGGKIGVVLNPDGQMGNISRKSQTKAAAERRTFLAFAARRGKPGEWLDVESRPEPEPDLLCRHAEAGLIAIELVRLIDERVAHAVDGRRDPAIAFSTGDPTARIIRSKLSKHYETPYPIELLVCWEPRLVTPDEAILAVLLPLLDARDHPFQRVWYFGEVDCRCVWTRADGPT